MSNFIFRQYCITKKAVKIDSPNFYVRGKPEIPTVIQEMLVSQDNTMCRVYLFKSILKSYWDKKGNLKNLFFFAEDSRHEIWSFLHMRKKKYKATSQESSQAVIMFCEMYGLIKQGLFLKGNCTFQKQLYASISYPPNWSSRHYPVRWDFHLSGILSLTLTTDQLWLRYIICLMCILEYHLE